MTTLDLTHASDSARLAQEIRTVLNRSPVERPVAGTTTTEIIERVDAIIEAGAPENAPWEWDITAAGLRLLANYSTCLEIAKTGLGNLLEEQAKSTWLTKDFLRKLIVDLPLIPRHLEELRLELLRGSAVDMDRVCTFLASIPLATQYRAAQQSTRPQRNADPPKSVAETPVPIIRTVVFVGQSPVASPQFLSPDTLYPLKFKIRGVEWPESAVRLKLNLNTTCPTEEFSVSDFAMDKPHSTEDLEYEGELSGHIRFYSKQSSVLDDIVFTVHGAFESSDGHLTEIPIIGHNELRLKVIDSLPWMPSRSGRPLDQHIMGLVEKLISDCPSVEPELDELYPMLESLSHVCATYAQEAAFKGRADVSEKELQEKVLHDLRLKLGAEQVQEHTAQAGGFTDIRYRGLIVELKVEKENGDRAHLAQKYTRQPAQYAGVEARQVSVLLVLDLTEKTNPPGSTLNDISLVDAATHGASGGHLKFPSKAFMFVVNGNTKNPSSYSR